MTAIPDRRAVAVPVIAAPADGRAKFDGGVRLVAGSALWLSLLLVAYWWAAGGGFQAMTGWETGLTSAGRLTGLLASDLLLAQVLLMARVPVLERAFGQDQLIRHHRLVGFTSFNLMIAHIVLITWGYAAGELGATPATIWDLTTDYPGMLLALAGTVALTMVVVTSVKAARRKIRYESWHLLHLYAYLGVGLALPHQLWTGQEFLASPGATVFWWTVWAAAAGAVLFWRVAVPLGRNLWHRLRVAAVAPEGDGVFSVYLTGRHLGRLRAEAGQFFTWRFLNRKGWTRGNPYSLSAAPDGRSLRITVKELGDNSARVAALGPGTRVFFEGPYGRLTGRARNSPKVALIGAGVGITPLRALAEGLGYAPGEAVLLHRFTDRPLFEREFLVLARERGLKLLRLPGRRRHPDSWLGDGVNVNGVDDLTALTFWVPDIAERDVYVCGPEQWTAAVRRSAEAAGVPAERLHIENFKW
ncbi:MAG TPA: ferredoxin reductase family protein [Amycolatopsis sp.]|uniref:ferredoxin reductase family protein n=1 Tax=Amycolatopsis sp. TaxID=37632 RepID=UPI002B49A413|nr:ferredoxin reductase family protein [Amycolatopsis sp.]HKS47738.1 ferredoxin reductase family protein [Amycolatopsis sp.]